MKTRKFRLRYTCCYERCIVVLFYPRVPEFHLHCNRVLLFLMNLDYLSLGPESARGNKGQGNQLGGGAAAHSTRLFISYKASSL